jgi:hypothetical protein
MIREKRLGGRPGGVEQIRILVKVGEAQEWHTALAGAEIFARAAQQQVLPRDRKAIGTLENNS